MTTKEFLKTYWQYYLNLEKDFLVTEKYVTIDKDNERTFSVEYLKIFQIVCAEIDIAAKVFCVEIDEHFNKDTLPHYCKLITTNFPDFRDKEINFKMQNIKFKPWCGWIYNENTDSNGVVRVTGSGPNWWTAHNKVKHSRTLIANDVLNYKLANQKNVIYALGGLFQLEMYFYKLLAQKERDSIEMPVPQSKLFNIDDWNTGIVVGDNLVLSMMDSTLSFTTKE